MTTINNNNIISIPWVEKYRPSKFEDVILSDSNKRMFDRIVSPTTESNEILFPNLIFYGPPGVGKTTTIIALIRRFHELHNQNHRALTIHLNASDKRGADVVHEHVEHFVKTRQLFYPGMKFVVLDEVDYMTQEAQKALCALIRSVPTSTVRFCLIGNYIGKIYHGLQSDFIKIRFNTLPIENILTFLQNICQAENLTVSIDELKHIQKKFNSDVRSMINTLQLRGNMSKSSNNGDGGGPLISNAMFDELMAKFDPIMTANKITQISQKSEIDMYEIIKNWISYIIWNQRYNPLLINFIPFADDFFHCNFEKMEPSYVLQKTMHEIERLLLSHTKV